MSQLQFFIRHQDSFLHDKMLLVFKSNEAKTYFQDVLKGCYFEELSSESAQHAIRIGIKGKIIPYGYTLKLTENEKNKLSTTNWDLTSQLLAEGNERLYKGMLEEKEEINNEKSSD